MAEAYTVVPLSPLRKVIAARMTQTKQAAPHFRIAGDIEVDALLAIRKCMNQEHSEAKVSVNDCIIKACAVALMKHPEINVHFTGDELHRYHNASISVMTAVPGGVAAPIVWDANRRDIWEISAQIKSLAERARAGRLRMEEIMGGSFSVSNLGAYGVDQFDAIINAPQCAILAVGRAKLSMLVSAEREARIATVMRVTLCLDHRAIDGATGAAFLRTLREMLEHPQELFGRDVT